MERDYWYQSALGRIRQRGQGLEDQNEGAAVEAAPEEVATAPQQTPPPPLPSKSIQLVSKPIDIPS